MGAFGDGATGLAPADPHEFIDPSFDPTFTGASSYQIVLSDGVGNGPPEGFGGSTAVPEPSSPVLFICALLGFDYLGRRKSQLAT